MLWEKTIKTAVLTLALLLCFPLALHAESNESLPQDKKASLYVNNNLLEVPVSPVFYNNSLLVPSREVFEPIGAYVEYSTEDKIVFIVYKGNLLCVQLDNPIAYIDNNPVELSVPPMLIDGKMMIPLRSVSENLGLSVTWDNDSKSAYINEKGTEDDKVWDINTPTIGDVCISEISVPSDILGQKFIILADSAIGKYESTHSGNKLIIDFYGAYFDLNYTSRDILSNKYVSKIRVGVQPYGDQVRGRVVFDLTGQDFSSDVSISQDRRYLNISFFEGERPTNPIFEKPNPNYYFDEASNKFVISKHNDKVSGSDYITENSSTKQTYIFTNDFGISEDIYSVKNNLIDCFEIGLRDGKTYISVLGNKNITSSITEDDSNIYIEVFETPEPPQIQLDRVVIIDAGHGGDDPGAVNGTIYEKDINYAIAMKLKNLIENDGKIKCITTRSSDVFITLENRAKYAQNVGGDVFVSIHVNASVNTSPYGIETYYYSDDSELSKNSKNLASIVQKNLIKYTGANDRGLKAEAYYVIKYNSVPSILIETGFISNQSEVSKLVTDNYQQKIAEAIYASILEYYKIG